MASGCVILFDKLGIVQDNLQTMVYVLKRLGLFVWSRTYQTFQTEKMTVSNCEESRLGRNCVPAGILVTHSLRCLYVHDGFFYW